MRTLLALLFAAAACGDNLHPDPGPACAADQAEQYAACQRACKPGDNTTGATCPGSTVVACVAECSACAPDVAWCPELAKPSCPDLGCTAALCTSAGVCSCQPPGETERVACTWEPAS